MPNHMVMIMDSSPTMDGTDPKKPFNNGISTNLYTYKWLYFTNSPCISAMPCTITNKIFNDNKWTRPNPFLSAIKPDRI